MQEGITLNLVLSGATLVGIIGVVVRLWISSRAHKIEQPLDIQPSLCARQLKSNSADHENIFCRLSASEQRLSAVEASVGHIDRRLTSMDNKLDRLLVKTAREELNES